jgi:hypothetical protein
LVLCTCLSELVDLRETGFSQFSVHPQQRLDIKTPSSR